jgi:hypothetical protein
MWTAARVPGWARAARGTWPSDLAFAVIDTTSLCYGTGPHRGPAPGSIPWAAVRPVRPGGHRLPRRPVEPVVVAPGPAAGPGCLRGLIEDGQAAAALSARGDTLDPPARAFGQATLSVTISTDLAMAAINRSLRPVWRWSPPPACSKNLWPAWSGTSLTASTSWCARSAAPCSGHGPAPRVRP